MIKKIAIKLIFISLIAIFLIPTLTVAEAPKEANIKTFLDEAAGDKGAGYTTDPELARTGLARVVGNVARAFISFAGVIFVSYIIYGGYLWMTAAGNEEKLTKAKKILRDGIIGLIIIIAAAGIYLVVKEGISAIPADKPTGAADPQG